MTVRAMRRTGTCMIIAVLVSMIAALAATAQRTPPDSLWAFREFARLGQMYHHAAVRLNIHMERTARPAAGSTDTLQTDMDLYYSKPDFYLNAEGLEEICNDSVVVVVNRPAKRIMVYPNHHQLTGSMEKTLSLFMPDSSVAALSKRYTAAITDKGSGKKQVTLTSRALVYGTAIPKEIVQAIYRQPAYELVTFTQTKTSLVPVDSAVFRQLQNEPAYSGRLVSGAVAKGKLFFLAKELTITCSFNKIDYTCKHPPVTERDRVEKTAGGNYEPVKGFEDYILSNPF